VLTYAYSTDTGELELSISQSFITQVYNGITYNVSFPTGTTSAAPAEATTVQSTFKRKYILGPS
jgi:hypothetical protein